ncbi:MAG: 5-(carboxyamino)imidazole ribonucleotide synthase [Roseiflexaceae bacterium]
MRIGVLGAGQLGRMLALAGAPLGLHCSFYDPAPASPASWYGQQQVGHYNDTEALEAWRVGLSCITYEFENVPVAAAELLNQRGLVYPPPLALSTAQDRLVEKQFFNQLGIATAPFVAVESLVDLEQAAQQLGLPAILKTRRMGYDGKGQYVLRSAADLAEAWAHLAGQDLILEGFVPFECELSILAARSRSGEVACYPLVQNWHREGILRRSVVPVATIPAALQAQAESYARRALEALEYVGVLAIELFQVGDRLLVNEMAPRVHNSGHWSIEGAETSQFEQHLRAILGWPLGSVALRGPTAMINLIGRPPQIDQVLAVPGAHLHLYDKLSRSGRKIGHITICAANSDLLWQRIAAIEALLLE